MRLAPDDAVVEPAVFRDLQRRLDRFIDPFAACLGWPEQRQHVRTYLKGLLSNLERKTVKSIAYLNGDECYPLKRFIGFSRWDNRRLVQALVRQIRADLGEADGMLVFGQWAFPKKGSTFAGVERQVFARHGKKQNCQIGVYLGYASGSEHALVDARLYLPKLWISDPERLANAGVPEHLNFRTPHQLALELLDEHGASLPHRWVLADHELGHTEAFRRELRARNERYLLAVPRTSTVHDLDELVPRYRDRARRQAVQFTDFHRWAATRGPSAWTRVELRAGEKGSRLVELTTARVLAKTDRRRVAPEEIAVVLRAWQADGTLRVDYRLSNAAEVTPSAEFARASDAEHRIGESLRRAHRVAGLSDYDVRTWRGWYHHQTLALIASWILTQEASSAENVSA
jgi:SRSO17 transposase